MPKKLHLGILYSNYGKLKTIGNLGKGQRGKQFTYSL